MTTPEPIIYAAPAPASAEDAPGITSHRDSNLDALCEQWVCWCRTRRMYGPAPLSGTVLGRLSGSRTRPLVALDPICSAELAAFHSAYISQPRESIGRQVFDAYYTYRIKPVKRAADALGISRQHFYALLAAFRVRLANAASAIAADNLQAHAETMARGVARRELAQA